MTEAISRQPNVDCVECLLVITLRQVYGGKEQVGQKEIHNVQLREVKDTGQMMPLVGPALGGDQHRHRDLLCTGIKLSFHSEKEHKALSDLLMCFKGARIHPRLAAKLCSVFRVVLALKS